MFKISAVVLMRNKLFVVREIDNYFDHLRMLDVGGFFSQTLLGRVGAGDAGGSVVGSHVPKGVEMGGVDCLCSINRMECALSDLKVNDAENKTRLWDFVQVRYGHRLKFEDISVVFDKSRSTLNRWDDQAISFIFNKII